MKTSRDNSARVRMCRLFTIPAAVLVSILATTAPASAGALLQLVAIGAQNLYLTDFTVQFDDGLAGAGDGTMDLTEVVPGTFSGVTDTSTETMYSTIVNVPDTTATTCATCQDAANWQFGGATSGQEGVLVVPATSFTYATSPLAVPEPSCVLLAAIGLMAVRYRRANTRIRRARR